MNFLLKSTLLSIFVLHSLCTIKAQLLSNGDFESASGCPTDNCGGYINTTCCPFWHRSHGTPYISNSNSKRIFMGAYNNTSEGIYYNYNFTQNKEYKICFTIQMYDDCSGSSNSVFTVKIANGVPETTYNTGSCFQSVPSATNSQLVLSDNSFPTSVTQTTVVFTANDDYSQLWFYPQTNTTCSLSTFIDDIYVYETCTPFVKSGNQQISLGTYDKHTTITAGSGVSNQTVSTDPTASKVEFFASDYVLLIPNFNSSPNTGNYFLAAIQPCPDCPSSKMGGINMDIDRNLNIDNQNSVSFDVEPNPFTRQTTIIYRMERPGSIEMRVYDVNGRMVLQKTMDDVKAGERHSTQLDLGGNPPGIYFLNAIIDGHIYTRKLILQD